TKLQVIIQGNLDDAGFNQNLGGYNIEALQRAPDSGVFLSWRVDQQRIIEIVCYHTNIVAEVEITTSALLRRTGVGHAGVGACGHLRQTRSYPAILISSGTGV